MRPVERGPKPTQDDGTPVRFTHYRDARAYLTERLGSYCSYCGAPASIALEHVQPKALYPDRTLDWHNFLLACVYCNSIKGTVDVAEAAVYWPDRDNTMRAIAYGPGALVKPHGDLSGTERTRAVTTIELCGLDRVPGARRDPSPSDTRWKNRERAWNLARRAKSRLTGNQSPDFRDQIVDTASANGFWPVWYSVFADDPDMLRRLRAAYPGTASACFDSSGKPVQRPGGLL